MHRNHVIRAVHVRDVRFPTSLEQDGSDALNLGDYSATYVTVETDHGLTGDGLTFTNGRGNEICVAAVRALQHHVVGRSLDEITGDWRAFYRTLTVDKQLRWLGPEKGILHMATGALLNAIWDLVAKRAGKPMWKLLADMTPEEIVAAIDFTYITDALTEEEALGILRAKAPGKAAREAQIRAEGYPAYTTSTGWLGYPDEKVRRLCREAMGQGWTAFKMKVGQSLEDNVRRAALMREEIGPGRVLMMDANQCWDVGEAIAQMKALARFDPWWIEEPTSPDDVLGHAAIARAIEPIRVATGEVVQNRVIFKQMLQAKALGFLQVDSCRMGGVNEVLAVLLLAAKFGVPVCPHAGGVGLCEYVQHISVFDFVAVSGSLDWVCEYVDHLHEHFVDPCVIKDARYVVPTRPGYSITMKDDSIAEYEFPQGTVWRRLVSVACNMAAPVAAAPDPSVIAGRPGYVRWSICALLLLATTINYIDRQVLGILAPTLQKDIGWTEVQYGYIVTSFQAAYAIGLLVVGRLLDVVGTKVGFAVAIVVWSIAAMLHGLARSPFGFGLARFALGLGESGNFPAAIKTVAEWFPRRERALATGIFNGGSNLGAVIAPAVVPWIALTYSWPWAFAFTGAIGFAWLGLWWFLYEPPDRHPRLGEAERALINSDPPEQVTPVPWLRLAGFRQTWAFAIAKFLTDPVWWFYLYWVPKFLSERHGIGLAGLGAPLITIYVIADIGSMGGGWLSSHLIRRGWSVDRSRKTAMLICALAVTPIVLAARVKDVWSAVALISLAAAAHQGWSANLFTLASDMFPRRAVGSVVGMGGMAGAVGGMLVATATGFLLQATGSYMLIFVLAGLAYLLALGIIQFMVPKVVPVELGE